MPRNSIRPKMFTCSRCNRGFGTLDSLRSHQYSKNHLDSISTGFDCNICRECFTTDAGLNQHQHAFHSICGDCNYFCVTNTDLTQHLNSTGHVAKFQCQLCLVPNFLDQTTYDSHLKSKAHQHRQTHGSGCADCEHFCTKRVYLREHLDSTGHKAKFECHICPQLFVSQNGYASHLQSDFHFRRVAEGSSCADCDRGYLSYSHFVHHLSSSGHAAKFSCGPCDKVFLKIRTLNEHLNGKRHQRFIERLSKSSPATEFRCCDCDCEFESDRALIAHLRDEKAHERLETSSNPITESSEPTCEECGKTFVHQTALDQHRASIVHNPISLNLKCIGKNGCTRCFSAPSAMIMHLESGSCPSNISRKTIDELIVKHDTANMITKGFYETEKLLGLELSETFPSLDSSHDSDGKFTLNTNNQSPMLPDAGGVASVAWRSARLKVRSLPGALAAPVISDDGSTSGALALLHELSCPLCPPDRKPFQTAAGLKAHIDSAAHAPKIYHCPDFLTDELPSPKRRKTKDFSLLSALTQHLESGACAGGNATFEKAINFVTARLAEMGQGDIRLIG